VGLLQREIEAAGFPTITLSIIADLTASVSAPRIVAIEHPFSLTMGYPGDNETQMAVLRATLQALVEMDEPGEVRHLPFEWPEHLADVDAGPPEPPPITSYLLKHPLQFKKLLKREFPEEAT
jgi:hypothetical protein